MDKKPVLAVVIILGLVALGSIGGAIALTCLDKNVPDGIWTTTGTAVGAIAAVLTSARYTPTNEGTLIEGQVATLAPATTTVVTPPVSVPTALDVIVATSQAATAPAGTQDATAIDPSTIPGYATTPAPTPAATPESTTPIVAADHPDAHVEEPTPDA